MGRLIAKLFPDANTGDATPDVHDLRFTDSDDVLYPIPFPNGAAAPHSPYLPHELISLIVQQCPISSYFRLTQVNTVFREIVYRNLPDPEQVPRKLAIHLLNNQESAEVPAPKFGMEEYRKSLRYKMEVLRRADIWRRVKERTSGNEDIDMLRCDMEYHRRMGRSVDAMAGGCTLQ